METMNLAAIQQVNQKTMGAHLDIEFISLKKDEVIATMPVGPKTQQPYGLLHGGASVALAESVASLGAWYSVHELGKLAVGMEINANHLRSVKSGIVTARGIPIYQGRTSQVWEIKIEDEKKRLICISRCTLAIIDPADKL